jgi:hypothetical protein
MAFSSAKKFESEVISIFPQALCKHRSFEWQ